MQSSPEQYSQIKLRRFARTGQGAPSRYGVSGAERLTSGFVAAAETKGVNRSDRVISAHKYILQKQLPLKPGAHEKQVKTLNEGRSSLLLPGETGLSRRRHRRGQQKRFAPRTHRDDIMSNQLELIRRFSTIQTQKLPTLSAGENCGGSSCA